MTTEQPLVVVTAVPTTTQTQMAVPTNDPFRAMAEHLSRLKGVPMPTFADTSQATPTTVIDTVSPITPQAISKNAELVVERSSPRSSSQPSPPLTKPPARPSKRKQREYAKKRQLKERNRQSAQRSRNRKAKKMRQLERQVAKLTQDNIRLRNRIQDSGTVQFVAGFLYSALPLDMRRTHFLNRIIRICSIVGREIHYVEYIHAEQTSDESEEAPHVKTSMMMNQDQAQFFFVDTDWLCCADCCLVTYKKNVQRLAAFDDRVT